MRNSIEKTRAYAQKRRKAMREWFDGLKEGKSCSRCGESNPLTLDYHHLDPSTKSFSLANMNNRGLCQQKVLDEIAKCELICANCHRKEHAEERIAS